MQQTLVTPERPAGDHPGLARDLCVFIDGTWDDDNPRDLTNVRKLFDATPDGVANGRNVFRLYVPGVGTKPRLAGSGRSDLLATYFRGGEPWDPIRRKVLGGLVGRGTTPRIKATYHFICDYYRRSRGDRIFLFGFSRGAFAARSLAGFLGQVGLLFAERLGSVERAYAIYESAVDPRQTELRRWLRKLTRAAVVTPESVFYVPVHFLGVWDTVACMGLPVRKRWENAPFTEHQQLAAPPNVVTARHALAVHELRRSFEPLLWTGEHGDIQQVWFNGAHADVGGGYAASEQGLSDVALRWMAQEAQRMGLCLRAGTPWLSTSAKAGGALHHEIRGKFYFATPSTRKWLMAGQTEPKDYRGHSFHDSAVDRLLTCDSAAYAFPRQGVNAALRSVDRHALATAIRAALFTQGAPAADPAPEHVQAGEESDWWNSVTPREVREAAETVRTFMEGNDTAGAGEVTAFARALALRELLLQHGALRDAARAACDIVGRFSLDSRDEVAVAEDWIRRGGSIAAGLSQCLELLAPGLKALDGAAVEDFEKELRRLDWQSVAARLRVGAREPVVAPLKALVRLKAACGPSTPQ